MWLRVYEVGGNWSVFTGDICCSCLVQLCVALAVSAVCLLLWYVVAAAVAAVWFCMVLLYVVAAVWLLLWYVVAAAACFALM